MGDEPLQQTLLPEPVKRATSPKSLVSSQYGEAAVEILKTAGTKGMHVDDIVAAILDNHALVKDPPEYIKAKVNAYLSNKAGKVDKPKAGSEIKRVTNTKTGRPKQGWYRYQKPREPQGQRPHILPDTTNTTLFGTGGEYAVASEYLYKGYNVSRPAVDDGIDLIVFKDGIFSNIQVKTSSSIKERFQFSIRTKAFENKSGISTFYVLLCRRVMKTHYRNDYIVLPSTAIEFFVNQGHISKSDSSISFGITINATDQAMLNGKHDITMYLNRF
ncbi:MAG: group I intron-associated PD-(D/E)XK endonuclease [Gammaproteobacteria bacterium]|nr:group I intron-associated PD-(D/E)XK endonuclease [Gammaproteobacteria bacterium]